METFGKYELIRRLGVGGMAEVYLAREPLSGGLSKLLVLKKIHPSLAATPEFVAMFEDEAKIAVNLNHPNVVQTFGYGQLAGTYFIAMELVEGIDLLRFMDAARDAGRKVPPGLCAYIGQQVAKGIDYAHRKTDEYGEALHIVHRDISPQNILLSFDGGVKIVDFGIARARDTRDDPGIIKGKFAYMSPEQAAGEPVDCRSDIFSTGIVLFELLTGRSLFGGLRGRTALDAIERAAVPALRSLDPDIPPVLAEIVEHALARKPEERFQTARDLQYALGRFFFDLGSHEGTLYESGTLAAFISHLLPRESRPHGVKLRPEQGALDAALAATPASTETHEPTVIEKGRGGRGAGRAEAAQSTGERPRSGPGSARDATEGVPVAPARERRNVVIIEGRLVGLEGLRRTVGEGRAREALLDFLRVADHVAYKHGALTGHLDERGFTYLLGMPTASEDDAARAVQLALALGEMIEGISRDLRPPLQLAIGIQRGLALVTAGAGPDEPLRYELLGSVGRLAERLAAEAMPGEVLAGGGIFRAARGEWRFDELEPVELRPDDEVDPGLPFPADDPSDFTPEAPARGEGDDAAAGARSAAATAAPRPNDESLLGDTAQAPPNAPAPAAPADGRRSVVRARVYRLLGARLRADRTEVVPMLIGRDRELQALADEHARVRATGRARYVIVAGDRGVGKRTLVRTFCDRLDRAADLVVRTAGRPMLRDTPYAMICDLVRDFLGVPEDAAPRELKRRLDSAVGLLFDAKEEHEARTFTEVISLLLGIQLAAGEVFDPGERRHRLYQALRQVAARIARGRTLVVLFEDLHLADRQSLALVHAITSDTLTRPVLVVATARPEGPSERLLDAPHAVRIVLDDLAPSDREELLRRRFESPDEPATRALLREILDRAGGNPFYLHETIESLVESGILAPSPGPNGGGRLRLVRGEAGFRVPPTVEAVVASRIDRLPEAERHVLRAAAVLGHEFRAAEVAALVDVANPAPHLAQLAARGLIDRLAGDGAEAPASEGAGAPAGASADGRIDGRSPLYGFRNAIIEEVAAAALPLEVRARLEVQVAAQLLASPSYRAGPSDARLARHLERAGDLVAAGRAWARAGAHARDALGNATAFRHFTAALRLLPAGVGGERWDLHAEREQILSALGKREAALREIGLMRELAIALDDRRRLAQTLLRLGSLHLTAGRHAAARRETARALAAARAGADRVTEAAAYRLEAALLRDIGRYAEALARTGAALDAVRGLEERAALVEQAQARSTIGHIQLDQGRRREARRAYAEALALYRRLGLRRLEAATLNDLGHCALGLGEYADAIRHYKLSLRLGQQMGDRVGIGAAVGRMGRTYALLGDLERARRYLVKALALDASSGDEAAAVDATLALGRVHLGRGEIRLAAEQLERGLELAQKRRSRYGEIRALVYLAFLRLESGDPLDTSLELARSAVRLARASDVVDGVIVGLTAEAMALERAGACAEGHARSAEAVGLLDAGHGDEEADLVLYIHARLCWTAGAPDDGRAALERARARVMDKANRLHDPTWRARYLAAPPARDIVVAAALAEPATAEWTGSATRGQ